MSSALGCGEAAAIDPVLAAALAHLWFVTVHPFRDGNGRIARAISDMALARSEGSPQRFYGMSSQIRAERSDYYAILGSTQQKRDLDVTARLEWFLACLDRALDGAERALAGVLAKARFWGTQRDTRLNDRQRAMINRLLDGFEGKLTSSKWPALAECSQDTALRDARSRRLCRGLRCVARSRSRAQGRAVTLRYLLDTSIAT